MKISKQSWHYRFLALPPDFKPPGNLCPYFWLVVFKASVVYPLAGAFLAIGAPIYFFTQVVPTWLVKKYPWLSNDYQSTKPPKPPGLVAAWIKSKKDHVCPTIEFTE
jgi:hypothetical protein